jgi:hypothetical protein
MKAGDPLGPYRILDRVRRPIDLAHSAFAPPLFFHGPECHPTATA